MAVTTRRNLAAANSTTTSSTASSNARRHRGRPRNFAVQQPGAENTRAARLAAAKEQEIRLREEAEAADQIEEASEDDIELTETLARVKQLQTEKADREARRSTTRPSTTTLTRPTQNSVQGESSFISDTLVSIELFD